MDKLGKVVWRIYHSSYAGGPEDKAALPPPRFTRRMSVGLAPILAISLATVVATHEPLYGVEVGITGVLARAGLILLGSWLKRGRRPGNERQG